MIDRREILDVAGTSEKTSSSGRRFQKEHRMSEAYLLYLYIRRVRRVENGQHLATAEDFPGLVAQGRTIAETVRIAQDVARKLIESYRERGDALPDGPHTNRIGSPAEGPSNDHQGPCLTLACGLHLD